MPLPLVPLIAAGAGLAGGIFSNLSARRQQKKAQEYNTTMWNKTNEYNSPQEQMKRWQEANLNPHLMYGQGNSGNAQAAPEFAQMSEEGLKSPLTPALDSFVDYQVKKAQLDNMKTQNKVMEQDAILRTIQTVGANISNRRNDLNLKRESELFQNSLDAALLNTKKMREDINYTHAQNIRADIDLANRTSETVERILTSRLGREEARIRMNNLQKEGRIKELEARLSDLGISPSTPWYAKALAQFLEQMVPKLQKRY